LSAAFSVIKAFRMRPGFRLATLAPYSTASALLLDGFQGGLYGGTGRSADWDVACKAQRRYGRMILAGGMRPENVAAAIARVRPYAVDVASGVEVRPGKKDARKMRKFMQQVAKGREAK
jgi:phosphoribosylanthranilate isomerase